MRSATKSTGSPIPALLHEIFPPLVFSLRVGGDLDKVANDLFKWWKANAENFATPAMLALQDFFFFLIFAVVVAKNRLCSPFRLPYRRPSCSEHFRQNAFKLRKFIDCT